MLLILFFTSSIHVRYLMPIFNVYILLFRPKCVNLYNLFQVTYGTRLSMTFKLKVMRGTSRIIPPYFLQCVCHTLCLAAELCMIFLYLCTCPLLSPIPTPPPLPPNKGTLCSISYRNGFDNAKIWLDCRHNHQLFVPHYVNIKAFCVHQVDRHEKCSEF